MGGDQIRGPVPVWLLDVDGVLTASRPGWGDAPRQGSVHDDVDTFRMRWAPKLMVKLARMHHDRVIELRWATTWVDHIERIETLLGFPALPLAFSGLTPHSSQALALKRHAALQVVETERRPLIWTDDDAIESDPLLVPRLRASGQPLLLISPDPRRGLQPNDLQAITNFIDKPIREIAT